MGLNKRRPADARRGRRPPRRKGGAARPRRQRESGRRDTLNLNLVDDAARANSPRLPSPRRTSRRPARRRRCGLRPRAKSPAPRWPLLHRCTSLGARTAAVEVPVGRRRPRLDRPRSRRSVRAAALLHRRRPRLPACSLKPAFVHNTIDGAVLAPGPKNSAKPLPAPASAARGSAAFVAVGQRRAAGREARRRAPR